MSDYTAARRNMVESQLRTNGVFDERVLSAMAEIPRELFFPEARRSYAYVDEDVPIGGGRHMMEPRVLARLLQMAEIGPHDLVLDIGSGPGYSAAVLSRLAGTVVALEHDARLAKAAGGLLSELGIGNVAVVRGPHAKGYPRQAPYDVILISGAVEKIPEAITRQLAEGGRLVAVVARGERVMGQGTLFERRGSTVSNWVEFDAATPLLPGFEHERGFVF